MKETIDSIIQQSSGCYSKPHKIYLTESLLIKYLNMYVEKNADAFAAFGTHLAANGEYERAVDYLSMAMKNNSKDSRLFFNRSYCYLEMDDHKRALHDIVKCIRLSPMWAKGFLKMGQILGRMKRFVQAEECYKKTLQLDPTFDSSFHQYISDNIYCALVELDNYDVTKAGFAAERFNSIEEARNGLQQGEFEKSLQRARLVKRREYKKKFVRKGILMPSNFF